MNSIVVMVGVLITLATGIPVMLQILRHHPRGLFVLFFTEMWERFSYYGMRGLLVFYLTQQLMFTDSAAAAQYGSYATLVYLLPLVGGVLADRYLGARKAVAFGALLLVAGHATMAIEAPAAHQSLIYHGARYAFVTTGQGETRTSTVQVGGHAYAYSQTAAGAFQIAGLPAGAAVPASLPKGAFSIETRAAPALFTDILYLALALIVLGRRFPEVEHLGDRRQALRAGRSPARSRLHPVLLRREPRGVLGGDPVRLSGPDLWLVLRLRPRRGRHARGVPDLPPRQAAPAGSRASRRTPRGWRGPCWARSAWSGRSISAPSLGLALLWFVVQRNGLVGIALGVGAAAALAYVGHYMVRHVRQGRARTPVPGLPADLRLGGLLHPVRAGRDLAQPVRRPQHRPAPDRPPGPLRRPRPRRLPRHPRDAAQASAAPERCGSTWASTPPRPSPSTPASS